MLAERRITEDETPTQSAGTIFDNLSAYGDKLALIDCGRRVSYHELIDQADRIGGLVCPRSLALVICANNTDAVSTYVGLTRAGAVPMLMPSTITHSQLRKIISAFSPNFIFAPADMASALPSTTTLGRFGSTSLLRNGGPQNLDLHDDLALMLSTSGSTGSLKFVRLSHQNLQANTRSITEFLSVCSDDRAITTMPMSYTYGLSILNTHLAAGASMILSESPMIGKAFWNTLRTEGATTFGGVPFVYEMLKKLRFNDMELPSLRYITQAGGRLPTTLAAEFADMCATKGIDFITMYGQTEATARMSYVPASMASEKAGCIGISIPGGKLWLRDDAGNRVSTPETSGELMYQGDNVSLGYAESADDLSRGNDNQGVLATGDIATFDEDDYFKIVGRKKRFLKIYGHRVNLDEIEQDLRTAGFDCACAGEDDTLSVFIASGDADRIKRHITRETNVNARALKMHDIHEIPRNAAGKILYADLQRLIG
jgi:long-chain acyl-CoA synthetase